MRVRPVPGANVVQAFARGESLDDAWEAPLFGPLRAWERSRGYGAPAPTAEGDWLRPCPIRDHHAELRSLLGSLPGDGFPSPDPALSAALDALDEELAPLTDPI